jgi:hypothetical protein
MLLLENYEKSLQAIYDHVGFEEDWVICPIDSKINMFWYIADGYVVYAKSKEDLLDIEKGNYYKDEIYTQRFYDKWVYEGKDLTMIFCDPHVDGMKWFRVFDNTKKVK